MHVLLHPSPSIVLLSSQGSTAAVIESPQAGKQTVDPRLLNVPIAQPVHEPATVPEYVFIGQIVQTDAPGFE